uniref:Odorant-binding protein n=1 Tax=Anoplophora chinensis TaxID=217632 RepID=A0A2H4ZB09_ANOCN|nr:odorant-binding protein [Anoplophora chinensis]
MKTAAVLCLCVIFFSAVQGFSKEQREATHKECLAQTGADEETVLKAMDGEFADDPKFKSYLLCFGKKEGFHNDAGELQKDFMRAKLLELFGDDATVDEMMKCAVEKATPEETAFEGCKCMYAFKNKFVDYF